jgi:uncharacterized membrane protein YhhN
MFTAIAPLHRILFGGLLIVWGLLFVTGVVWGRFNADRSSRLLRPNKLLMSVVLVISAATWWLGIAASTPLAPYGAWITFGMLFGLVGDALLADVFRVKHSVPLGMAAFGVGHILYSLGYSFLGQQLGIRATPLAVILILAAVVAAISWRFLAWNAARSRVMILGALIYSVLLCGMAGMTVWLALGNARLIWLMIGALLFVISDMLLAGYLFGKLLFVAMRDVVWLLYTVGQALIVFSIGTALNTI